MSEELYTPREHQARIESALARFSVLVCHRRFGKTVLSVNRLIRSARATDRSDWRGAYIAPLYRQAKTVVWDELKRYCGLGRDDCTVKFNETELRADFDNGARIRLFGANNPDSLRGMYLDGVVFDEVAQMPLRVWTEVIRPGLVHGHVPRVRDRDHPPGRVGRQRAGDDARGIRAGVRMLLHRGHPGAYFGQLLADADREGRVTRVPHDPAMPVHTAWDLGMSDSTSIWFVQARPGGTYAVIDYYEANGEGLDHYARVLDKKNYKYGVHVVPHDIRVRELGTGRSRLETARSLGIRFRIAPNIPI